MCNGVLLFQSAAIHSPLIPTNRASVAIGYSSNFSGSRRCPLNYRRVEEIQDIQIGDNQDKSRPKLVDRDENNPPRQGPRPLKPQSPEDDVSRYTHVQLIDIDFHIVQAQKGEQAIDTTFPLDLHDLRDPDLLAERFANLFGLSMPESLDLVWTVVGSLPSARRPGRERCARQVPSTEQ